MKHIMLAAALFAASLTSAFAGERPTKAENTAAMQTGRKMLAAKTTDLEKSVASHNTQAAESAAMDVLVLMRRGVGQTRTSSDFESSSTQQKAIIAHMLDMEHMVHDFTELTRDMSANGTKLVDQAHVFMKAY